MLEPLILEVDTIRKYRGKEEWRPINRVRTTYQGVDYEVSGDHAILVEICKELVASGYSGVVDIRREGRPVFLPISVEKMASNKFLTDSGKEQPEQLKKWREEQKKSKMSEENE